MNYATTLDTWHSLSYYLQIFKSPLVYLRDLVIVTTKKRYLVIVIENVVHGMGIGKQLGTERIDLYINGHDHCLEHIASLDKYVINFSY